VRYRLRQLQRLGGRRYYRGLPDGVEASDIIADTITVRLGLNIRAYLGMPFFDGMCGEKDDR
jgi:hypothetical protein